MRLAVRWCELDTGKNGLDRQIKFTGIFELGFWPCELFGCLLGFVAKYFSMQIASRLATLSKSRTYGGNRLWEPGENRPL